MSARRAQWTRSGCCDTVVLKLYTHWSLISGRVEFPIAVFLQLIIVFGRRLTSTQPNHLHYARKERVFAWLQWIYQNFFAAVKPTVRGVM